MQIVKQIQHAFTLASVDKKNLSLSTIFILYGNCNDSKLHQSFEIIVLQFIFELYFTPTFLKLVGYIVFGFFICISVSVKHDSV